MSPEATNPRPHRHERAAPLQSGEVVAAENPPQPHAAPLFQNFQSSR
jgi:hypothetical protein